MGRVFFLDYKIQIPPKPVCNIDRQIKNHTNHPNPYICVLRHLECSRRVSFENLIFRLLDKIALNLKYKMGNERITEIYN